MQLYEAKGLTGDEMKGICAELIAKRPPMVYSSLELSW